MPPTTSEEKQISTVKELVGLWSGFRDLAGEIGVEPVVVRRWAQRNSIPSKYHLKIVRSALRLDLKVGLETIARIHDDGEVPGDSGEFK